MCLWNRMSFKYMYIQSTYTLLSTLFVSCINIHHTKPGLNNTAGVNKAGEGNSQNRYKIHNLKSQWIRGSLSCRQYWTIQIEMNNMIHKPVQIKRIMYGIIRVFFVFSTVFITCLQVQMCRVCMLGLPTENIKMNSCHLLNVLHSESNLNGK